MAYRFIFFLLLWVAFSAAAQDHILVDTIANNYKLVYENGQAQYQYNDANNKKRILNIPSEYQKEFLLHDSGVRTSEKIKPGKDNLFYQKKIYSIENFKTICPQSFDKVYGEVANSFAVSKNDSCFLLNIESCELKFIHPLVVEDLVLVYNYRTIQVFNDYEKTLTVYDTIGTQLGIIALGDYFYSPIDNGYFIRLGLDESSLKQTNFQNRFVTNEGEFVVEGKIIAQGKDVLAIEKKSGEIEYFFKDQRIQLPNDTKSLRYDRRHRFCTTLNSDGQKGIYSLDFKKELVPAKYKSIDYLSSVEKVRENYQSGYPHYGEGEFYFYALDPLEQLHILDLEGNEIKLDTTYKNVKLKHFGLGTLHFFTITDKELNIHIYDKDWNFIGTERDKVFGKNTEEAVYKYYYLYKKDAITPKALTLFRDDIEKDFRFILFNKKGGRNIFDRNFTPLLSQDYKTIMQVSDTHFIVSKAVLQLGESNGESTIIELRTNKSK